jgi:hypothetical protein
MRRSRGLDGAIPEKWWRRPTQPPENDLLCVTTRAATFRLSCERFAGVRSSIRPCDRERFGASRCGSSRHGNVVQSDFVNVWIFPPHFRICGQRTDVRKCPETERDLRRSNLTTKIASTNRAAVPFGRSRTILLTFLCPVVHSKRTVQCFTGSVRRPDNISETI